MGFGSSKHSEVAEAQVQKALAAFPPQPVNGPEEKRGLGTINENFGVIKSFTWSMGGSGTVNIKKVENVSMDKNVPKGVVVDECTGLFYCAYATDKEGNTFHIKKANVLHFYHVNCTKIIIDECNVCIIHGCNTDAEFTVDSGKIVCVDNGDIIINKPADVSLEHWDGVGDDILTGQAAVDKFKEVRNNKPGVLNEIGSKSVTRRMQSSCQSFKCC